MLNKVQLIGHLGSNPETTSLQNETKVTKFSLATTEVWKDKSGNKQERTEWHKIVCWGNLAEIASKYLTKGKQIFVEGKIRTHSWDDEKSGDKKYIVEIIADNFLMLGKKEHDNGAKQTTTGNSDAQLRNNAKQEAMVDVSNPADDLPF